MQELSGGGGYTPCGGGYTIHLSYRVVVEEVIHPVEEVILFCGGGYTPCGGGYTTPKILLSSPVPLGHWDWGTGA